MGEQRRYRMTDYRFGRLALTLREKAGLTQAEVADALGVSQRTIQHWEAGTAFPAAANLKGLIALYMHHHAFAEGHEREEARALWAQADESAGRRRALFDEAWFDALLQQRIAPPASQPSPTASASAAAAWPLRRADWGDAPEAAALYGRERELATLAQWVIADRCRVVVILGMGGIGKTTLAVRFAQAVAPQFARVFWRSLRNAPPLAELLADCLHTLAEQPSPTDHLSSEHTITLLIDLLRQQRCLLILDNVETLLEAGNLAGRYRAGYEGYRQLFQRIAETAHQSCLLLTSREMLSELEPLEGTHAAVRALKLSGLARTASQELLKDKDLFGPLDAWDVFVRHYAGNPLALKIAAATVRALFGGDLAAYLREAPVTLHTLNQLLEDQFTRLSPLERAIMVWLAIEREGVALEELSADLAGAVPKHALLAALQALLRRSLVERSEHGAIFMVLPVVLEYVSNWLVAQVAEEIIRGDVGLIAKYALMKSQSKDYIRDSQVRMIVQPVLTILLAHFGDPARLVAHLQRLLHRLRAMPPADQGYAGGNLVNLLVCLHGHLRGWDFSRLVIRQAYLQEAEAQDASFADASLSDTRFMEPLETISAMTLSPDGRYLAIGSFSGQLRVWHVADGRPVWSIKSDARRPWALAFNPQATILASGGYHGQVRLWDVASGRSLAALEGHNGWVRVVVFSPDGSTLVTAGDDATIRVWEVRNATCRQVLYGHQGLIWSAAFSPDGTTLFTGGIDGTIRVWQVHTGTCLRIMRKHTDGVFSLTMRSDGALLVSGGEDGQIYLWDARTGEWLTALRRHGTGTVTLTFNPEGTLLASGSNEGIVDLWQIDGAGSQHYLRMLHGHRNWVSGIAFARRGLLATASFAGRVRIWEAQSGKVLKTFQGYSRLISALAFSPDGHLLAQGDGQGGVRLWDMHSGHCLAMVQGHTSLIRCMAFSPHGQIFASCGEDRTVKLWDVGGQCLKTFEGHTAIVWVLAFSPDGTLLASGGVDREIRLWTTGLDGETTALSILHGSPDWIWSLAFAPDGRVLASGHTNGEVRLWEVATGRCFQTLQHGTGIVDALSFSADGRMLISSSNDVLLRRWEVASGRCVQTVPQEAPGSRLRAIAFTPGNRMKAITFSGKRMFLATAVGDHTVQLWRIEPHSTAHQVTSFADLPGEVWAVALSADQRALASSDDEGTIIVWDAQTGAVLHRLCPDRPYERMNISGITGINTAQRAALKALGAVDVAVEVG